MNKNERSCLKCLLMYMDMALWKYEGIMLTDKQHRALKGIADHYPEFKDAEKRHDIILGYIEDFLSPKEA